ncbi:MAG: hypothetical protein VB050_12720 [Geobacteraceae bacterium]|nr:hypothetical protein [Geobacteraceae bacterium]
MPIPTFKLLQQDSNKSARLTTIRNAVEPLLGSNYLSHFTDHSVNHSDQLCNIVDELVSSLDQGKELNPEEAFVLYAACYLHDIGMQHQRACKTEVVRKVLLSNPYCGLRWESLELETRQEIIRAQHHLISDELIRGAVRTGDPAIGIPLNDSDKPGVVAALCSAHCLLTDSTEYQCSTADQGGLRVGLLAALLRLADILDESQRRSHLFLEKTRDLPLESRLHWWRHYYVSNITINPREIIVWFDFPPERRVQYKEIFEPLQMPWIEAEHKRHSKVLAENGLAWHLQARDTPEAQCTSRVMDDELERYAVEKIVVRRVDELNQQRATVVTQLRVARPTVQRQLATLQESTDAPDELLREAVNLAEHLSAMGGKRDAWMILQSEHNRLKPRVSEEIKLNVDLRIGEMMIEDNAADSALRHLRELTPYFSKNVTSNTNKLRYLRIWAIALREACAYHEAVVAFEEIAQLTDQPKEQEIAMAEIAELRLLQGDLAQLSVFEGGETC